MKIIVFFFLLIGLIISCTNKKVEDKQALVDENRSVVITDTVLLKWREQLNEATEKIRFFIENREPNERYFISDEELFSSVLIPRYYVAQDFKPCWFSDTSVNVDRINEMVNYIENLKYHGLIPEDYHLEPIKKLLETLQKEAPNSTIIAHLDVLLSDAFFIIASHLYNGKVDPEVFQAEWGIQRGKPELIFDVKLQKLVVDSIPIEQTMIQFYPDGVGYITMVHKAAYLSEKSTKEVLLNIPVDSLGNALRLNYRYREQVLERLEYLGYFSDTIGQERDKDPLPELLAAFQSDHGLNEDGLLGQYTYEALTEPVDSKITKLLVNMERLRWLPITSSDTLVSVNIADYTMVYRKGEDTLLKARTVVGKNFRQTPVFEAKLSYLVFSPTWTIPPTILRNDILPKVAKDSNYLKKHSMEVFDRYGNKVAQSSIDWRKAVKGNFPYVIRQEPGPENPLGRVKFMFPNKYSVYIHDTPIKSLFARDERTFSSGCIRMEAPKEFARILLNDTLIWNNELVEQAMFSDKEQTVVLKKPINVSIFYLTAWGTPGKRVQFRKDIYDRDNRVFKALQAVAPY